MWDWTPRSDIESSIRRIRQFRWPHTTSISIVLGAKPKSCLARTQKHSQYRLYNKPKSYLTRTQKQSQLRPLVQTNNFDIHTKTKPIPIPHTNIKITLTQTLKSSHNLSRLWKKSTLMPPKWRRSQLRPPTWKPSIFRSPHLNQVNCEPDTETKICLIPHTEIKSISTTYTKKSTSMTSTKPSNFGPNKTISPHI